MAKIITFTDQDVLINTDPFYAAIGDLAVLSGKSSKELEKVYLQNEYQLLTQTTFIPYSEIVRQALKACETVFEVNNLTTHVTDLMKVYQNLPSFREVSKTLMRLKENGYQLGLLSNLPRPILEHNLANFKVTFDQFWLAEDLQCYQPQAAFFDQVTKQLRQSGIGTSDHIHVTGKYLATLPENWQTIWLNRNSQEMPKNRPSIPVIKHLDELLKKLA
ncbi:HAD hydrolase-like protein [Loigolactobacillus iwatensis]|uniref:HAD hydrolase-like protein n=1 Tax=Loigolactobacillus iwatensis TaxID=1267156 RepID=UPI000F7F0623|nr:HAD hydrolase-like protein [Loigolactobacillus iwatensis]